MNLEQAKKQFTDGVVKMITENHQKNVNDLNSNGYDRNPSIEKRIINEYTAKCSSISFAAAIVPGPWGALTIIPDLLLVYKYQIEMISKLSYLNGKEAKVTPELLLYILFEGISKIGISTITIKGTQVMTKRVGARVLQKIVNALGGSILQKAITKFASRWIPVAGSTAMGIWTGYLTKKIANRASEIFKKDIVDEAVVSEYQEIPQKNDSKIFEDKEAYFNSQDFFNELKRLKALIHLVHADDFVHSTEKDYLLSKINESDLDNKYKQKLKEEIFSTPENNADVPLPNFDNDQDKIIFISELIALAKIDNEFDDSEKEMILQIGGKMQLEKDDVSLLF